MKKPLKKAACVLATVALASTMVALPATAEKAHAATKPHMKSLGLKWDLKKNRTVKFKTSWPGAGKGGYTGYEGMTATIKNWKVSKAQKKGYKKATFTLVFNNRFSPTKKQIRGMKDWSGNWNDGAFGYIWYAVVDYNTGKSLEVPNDKGVTVKSGKWRFTGGKKYKSDLWSSVHVYKKATVKVTITYPSKYKGLCIGVGGNNVPYSTLRYYQNGVLADDYGRHDKVDYFWDGKAPFGKTSLYNWKLANKTWAAGYNKNSCYTKSKANSHWMRLK